MNKPKEIMSILFITILLGLLAYTQVYKQYGNTEAIKGMVFLETIHLKEYKSIGGGFTIFGVYNEYVNKDCVLGYDDCHKVIVYDKR